MPEYAPASSLRVRLSATHPAPHPARSHPRRCPPDRPGAPSLGPSSSSGRSAPTSSVARVAEAPAASWPSCFAPPRPRPYSSTSASPPDRSPSLRPPPRRSSASGECSPSFETRPGLTTAPGLLYPHTRAQAFRAPPGTSLPLSPRGLPARTGPRKPGLFFLGSGNNSTRRRSTGSWVECDDAGVTADPRWAPVRRDRCEDRQRVCGARVEEDPDRSHRPAPALLSGRETVHGSIHRV
jgi:hypothetical protein